jgi:hypothetical protein
VREPRNLLLGQNVTPRHPRRVVPVLCCSACLALGVLAGHSAQRAASWPPAHLRLVPPIHQPQGTVAAYIPTQLDWLVRVVWEPVHAGRFLGAEPVKDADVCTVHVAAEIPYASQLAALQAGIAKCFAETFTREPFPEDG